MTIQPLAFPRGGAGEIETFAMANCQMLLSSQTAALSDGATAVVTEQCRMFSCKTCGRKFSSFQALGGHRASHKKNKPSIAGDSYSDAVKSTWPVKQKTHACSICGIEFPIGQALGGHMRRHRPLSCGSVITTETSADNNSEKKRKNDAVSVVPVLKKSNSSKRVCVDYLLNLDLNLSTCKYEEDEIEEGEIVEDEKEAKDCLKLELRQPINWTLSY